MSESNFDLNKEFENLKEEINVLKNKNQSLESEYKNKIDKLSKEINEKKEVQKASEMLENANNVLNIEKDKQFANQINISYTEQLKQKMKNEIDLLLQMVRNGEYDQRFMNPNCKDPVYQRGRFLAFITNKYKDGETFVNNWQSWSTRRNVKYK